MTQDLIRYDVLVQDALRGVVRKVMTEVARTGLPGDHHFYVSFDTRHPGVRLSSRLLQRYPSEMTIVLQHQFWDLQVTEVGLEVGLSFNGIPERLVVPFAAIKGFVDPSVEFGLQFEVLHEDDEDETEDDTAPRLVPTEASVAPLPEPERESPAPAAETPAPEAAAVAEEAPPQSATVLSLDKFRKKP